MAKKNFKMVDSFYDKKKKRQFITLEESGMLGFNKELIDYVDSQYIFTQNKDMRVFYRYPEMKQLDYSDPRTEYLTDCLRRIKFENSGEILP